MIVLRLFHFLFVSQNIEGFHKCAVGIAITLILLEWLSLHYFRNDQIRRHALADGEKPVRTLLIGVTPMARLYRNLLASDIE